MILFKQTYQSEFLINVVVKKFGKGRLSTVPLGV